jgi:hypothetical protein
MSGPFSDVTDSLFAEKDVLSESYQLEGILERDEEIIEYRYDTLLVEDRESADYSNCNERKLRGQDVAPSCCTLV